MTNNLRFLAASAPSVPVDRGPAALTLPGTPPERRDAAVSLSLDVVIPCYRVRSHILDVIAAIGPDVRTIYVVDDACPEQSGRWVAEQATDSRVRVLFHERNQGVGGATMTGMRRAIADGADIIVKLDGDGQMDPRMIPLLVEPIRRGAADHAKGNRFHDPEGVAAMPVARLIGNAALSFLAKLSTGYWQSFDPTNGFIAIHAEVASRLPLRRIHRRYFFETDLLFRLNILRARVVDVPMPAIYGSEQSNLRILRNVPVFLAGHLRNIAKRILYNYFLRDFSLASIELVLGLALLVFAFAYGFAHWGVSSTGASAGIVMMSGLPIILGVQFLLAFLAYDIQSAPSTALHPLLARRRSQLLDAGLRNARPPLAP